MNFISNLNKDDVKTVHKVNPVYTPFSIVLVISTGFTTHRNKSFFFHLAQKHGSENKKI